MGWINADSSNEEEKKSEDETNDDDESKSNRLKGRVEKRTPNTSENHNGNRTLRTGRGKTGARAKDQRHNQRDQRN